MFCDGSVPVVTQERWWRQSLLYSHVALDSILLGEVPPHVWQKRDLPAETEPENKSSPSLLLNLKTRREEIDLNFAGGKTKSRSQ